MQRTEGRGQITDEGRRTKDERQGGFTLIETIITLVVLSIAAVGVLSVFTTGIKSSADPLILNQAISLAQEKMDEAIALKKSGGFAAVIDASGVFPAPYAAYTWTRVVVCVDAGLGVAVCPTDYRRVTITVSWNVGADSVSLVTLVTNY